MFNINSTDTVLMETKLCEDIRKLQKKVNDEVREVVLRRKEDLPLGFAITGGIDHGTGIIVSEVYSQSEAEKEGLKPGDQILRVNGFSIEQAGHDDVINLIKSANKIVLKVRSIGMIPIKENRAEQIQWKFISDLQQQTKLDQNQMNSVKSKQQQFKQKNKSKCPIHSLKKEDGQIAKILLKNDTTKLIQTKQSIGSAGSSPTSSVSSKCSSSSITSSSLSSCSKLIAKSCKSVISSSASSQKPKSNKNTKLNGYYSRSLSNLANSDFIDEFSLSSTSTINFTRNKSTSNLNLEIVSTSISPERISSSITEDDSTLEKVKSNKYNTIYINLSNKESLGCSVVKGPAECPGIFIQTIKQNGVADKAGLEVGDQIISLNDLNLTDFSTAIEKIKSCKQMKFKVKKNTAIGLFLEQSIKNKLNNKKLTKKTVLNDPSSSSSCNESSSSPIGHLNTTNYRHTSSSSSSKNTCNSHHLPYYMNKYSSSRHNLNKSNCGQFIKPIKNNGSLIEHSSISSSSCAKRSLRSNDSKKNYLIPLRKNIAHHRSYTSLKFLDNPPNLLTTYGQRMNGYHSPVCLRHSSTNYYSQSENDYSMYEMEEHNENKKIDLIENSKFINTKNYGYSKNSRQFKSKSIRNLNRYDNCDKCNCLNNYYAGGSDCNEYDYRHKKILTTFNKPINSNLLKQKLLCNNLSCSNLTFKSQTDIGLSNCQQLCTLLNNQMNSLQLTQLNEEIKSKSNLELNEDLILNNKIYEKMRLEKERLAIERKKLENEQLRLKEEKDKFEREKKQMETLKQNEELKSISSSSTISTTSAVASQINTSINSSTSSTTQSSIGFLDEIKKLAERRTCENSLITNTLNKTPQRFIAGEKGAVRLLPIADGKIKHPDDEKRKQHEILMAEFRLAHSRMFPKNQIPDKATNNSTKEITTTTKSITEVSSSISTNITTTNINSNNLALNSKNNFEITTSSNSNELNTEINSNHTSNNLQNSNILIQTNNLTSSILNSKKEYQIITPPPLPNLNIINQNNQDGTRKLNTFGKLVIQNDNQNKLPTNLLPKNNLNGLNQNETVKILRTSSPNKKSNKGRAPQPPILDNKSNDKLAKIVKVNKKEEKATLLNSDNLYNKNQIKLEGQKNGSLVVKTNQTSVNRSLEVTKYTSDLVEKSNYLSTSDISLSSLSIKVD